MTRRRLGIIVRADDGGLGNQTRDVVEHLGPDVILIMLLGENARGVEAWERVKNDRGPITASRALNQGPRLYDENIDFVLERCDVLYTVEGPYHGDGVELFHRCNDAGVELVIHANPELYKGFPCHRLLVPTTWRLDQMPSSAEVLPHPIDLQKLTPTIVRGDVPTFVHLTGPAMLDRQGTQLVFAALPYVRHECDLMVRHDGPWAEDVVGNVRVQWLPRAPDYWGVMPPNVWALIQPRRYGGLSLCIQEAAARGIPTIALDREPESTFYADITFRCPVFEEQPYPMAGGEVGVADADPRLLAAAIDEFIDTPENVEPVALWAVDHAWPNLIDRYEEVLR